MRSLLLGIVVIAILPAVQVTVVNRLPIPGASPDLVLLAVVMMGATRGALPGAVTGFAAGLVLDAAPPADHAIGASALALCLAGYAGGLLPHDRSAGWRLAAMALGALVGTVAGLGAGLVLGNASWQALPGVLPAVVAYDVVAGPLLGLALVWLGSRPDRDAPETSYLRGHHV